MIILVMCDEEYKNTELWGSVCVNSTVFWVMMLCSLLEIYRHFGGTSVSYHQITWSHTPRILYSLWRSLWRSFSESLSYFGPLGPGVIFSWQCKLWFCSDDSVVQFLAGAEIFFLLFISIYTGFGVNPASYPLVKQSAEVKLTTHLYPLTSIKCQS